MGLTRRSLIKGSLVAGAVGLAAPRPIEGKRSRRRGRGKSSSKSQGLVFGYTPFTQPLEPGSGLPLPLTELTGANRLDPAPGLYPRPGGPGPGPVAPTHDFADVSHGIAPEFGHFPDMNQFNSGFSLGNTHETEFGLVLEETLHQFVPGGPEVPIFAYRDVTHPPGSGTTPGPTIVTDVRAPTVLRSYNALTADRGKGGDGQVNTTHHAHESSIHLHGGHNSAHSDGYPDFYNLAGESRDYWYTNCGPQRTNPATNIAPVQGDDFDPTWIPSTCWYHDHAMDVTGYNVAKGLAGFYLCIDERELELADSGVIPAPGGPQDIGLVLTDQRFNADGTIFYDFLDHNGRIGDVFTVNGMVQPYLEVERRKYRFRFLNGSNARVYEVRLSTGQKMCIIGTDTWLLPRGVEVESFEVSAGMRQDVIIDFRDAPDEVYLENIMIQKNGRKGNKLDPRNPTPLLQFRVRGPRYPVETPCVDGTVIRGFAGVDPGGQWSRITEDEVIVHRQFAFDRSAGAFTVNGRYFNPRRSDGNPKLGVGAEHWTMENKAGGWWHPIHTHLEGHQVLTVNGKPPRRERAFNQDLTLLHGGEVAETRVKFRTFTGPFVFHCHTIEHEDMRMMGVIDPTPTPENTEAIDATPPLDGKTRIDPAVSGVVPDCIDLEHEGYIYYDEVGDLDLIDERGVGFPECEFDEKRRGNRKEFW